MLIIGNNQVTEKIYQSNTSIVYRAQNQELNKSVVLKLLNTSRPSPEQLEQFTQEFNILNSFSSEGIVQGYQLEEYNDGLLITMEDFYGVPLSETININKLKVGWFLELAIILTTILETIHAKKIVHKDISPENILYNSTTGQLKIIDFSIAKKLTDSHEQTLEGSLPYLAPEQTGRTSHGIDYRSDLYALGTTLYHILTGAQPFQTSDAMEMIHFHLAKEPTPAHKTHSAIPVTISNIISKLMEKSMENRYQSCAGLRNDLQKCLEYIKSSSPLVPFELGQRDSGATFQLPDKLFGRKTQRELIQQSFITPDNHTTRILLISGDKGYGKTSLAEGLRDQLLDQGDYFVAGTFFKETVFGPIINALQDFVRQLFTDDKEKINAWKKRLKDALQEEARVITDILPEIETLLGPQPALPILSPSETVSRFTRLIKAFIQASCSETTRLIIFLDDVQWAAPPTIELLKSIITDQKITNLGFIFTLETTEVNRINDLFYSTFKEVEHFTKINLSPLSNSEVQGFIAETLKVEKNSSLDELTAVIIRKTGGVPLYLKLFFLLLYHKGHFKDPNNLGYWEYDLEAISKESCTENVIASIIDTLPLLPERQLNILQAASCISGPFRLNYLNKVVGFDTKSHLKQAVKNGIIEIRTDPESGNSIIEFVHPNIRDAIYTTIRSGDKKELHLNIGRLLLKDIGSREHTYEIADQLNSAQDVITRPKELLELAEINLQAGMIALQQDKVAEALQYTRLAHELLPEDHWQSNSSHLSLKIHRQLCKAAQLNSQSDLTGKILKTLLAHTDREEIILEAYGHHLTALKATNKLHEAMLIGIEALKFLDVHLPEHPTELQRIKTLLQLRAMISFKKISALDSLPEMTDPRKLTAIRFLLEISPIAYSIEPILIPFISQKAMQITLKYGNSRDATAAGYALFAIIQCTSEYGNIKKGIALGETAMEIFSKLGGKSTSALTPWIANNYLLHWNQHLLDALPSLRKIYKESSELGLKISAANSISYRLFISGTNLQTVAKELSSYRRAIDKSNQQVLIYRQMIYQQLVENLIEGDSNSLTQFAGSFYNEKKLLHLHEQENDQTTLFQLFLIKLIQSYIFKQFHEGLKISSIAEKYTSGAIGSIFIPLFLFFDSMTRLALYREQKAVSKRFFIRKVEENQKKMHQWSLHAPMNFLDKYYLVEAEKAKTQNKKHQAFELYDKAIDEARKSKFLLEEAIAHERLAQYYKEIEKNYLGKSYLQEARYCYSRWGAMAKVHQLDKEELPPLPSESAKDENHAFLNQGEEFQTRSRLDMMAVIKASRTLTSEIVLEELLKKMLRIMIENAGAQKGFLLFQEDGEWVVRAKGSIILVDTNVKILSGTIEEYKNELSRSIIQYVARTGEIIVLNDATSQGLFTHDNYIITKKPKSILCAPIIHQGQTSCILYLENNLTTRAFPPERQETLNILGTQAAISLKNSTLYSDLGRTVEQLHKEIDKRKETQRQLLHAEKLTALGRLSASIAHEFGNPLMGIRYLLEDFHSRLKLPQEDQELVKLGLEECNRMKNLMNELHQLDKPSSGKMGPFNLHSTIDNVLTFQGKIFTSRNIVINKKYDERLSQLVAVEDQITQVLINLIMNATDAIPAPGGVITISTLQQDDWIVISIHDTGSGVELEHQEKIFEPFFSTKPEVEGTGLGLPTSYGIITGHGGDITCNSAPGQGTTFTIKLPRATTDQ